MISILITAIVFIAIVAVLFMGIDYFARAGRVDVRLWFLLKGIIVVIALVAFLQRTGLFRD